MSIFFVLKLFCELKLIFEFHDINIGACDVDSDNYDSFDNCRIIFTQFVFFKLTFGTRRVGTNIF